tara:strand:- start:396 stop:686 length:291 start_codon:yes stop_codon:yes gene_type:complete
MSEKAEFDAKLKKFIGLTFLVIFLTCVEGLIGGWLIYQNAASGSEILGIQLFTPAIVATILMCIALVMIKNKLFGTKAEFQASLERFKEQNEQAKK